MFIRCPSRVRVAIVRLDIRSMVKSMQPSPSARLTVLLVWLMKPSKDGGTCMTILNIHANYVWLHDVTTIHDSRQYGCPEFQRVYVSKSGLIEHVYKKHRKITRYRCETCGKGFFCRSVYHDHIAAHTGVKRHTCSICEMKFMNKSTLKKQVLHFRPNEAANMF